MAFRERNPNSMLLQHNSNNESKLNKGNKVKDFSRPLPVSSKENDVLSHRSVNQTIFFKSSQNRENGRVALTNIYNHDPIFYKGYDQSQGRKVNDGVSVWSDSLPPVTAKASNDNSFFSSSVGHNSCDSVSSFDKENTFDLEGIKNEISSIQVGYSDIKENLGSVIRKKSVQSSLQTAYRADKENSVNLATKLNYSAAAKKNLPTQVVNHYSSSNDGSSFNKIVEQKHEAKKGYSLEDYGRALHRMGESSQTGGAEFAETLLREMLEKYATGKHSIRPDGACYNSVIHSYAELGNAEKAESILRLMFDDYQDGNERAEPNVRVYTNVLHAWRKAKAPNAPERCETILKEMYELSDKGILPSCKPDTFAVTVLLHCWTESNRKGASLRAETIFRRMKNRYLAGEREECPDCIAYSIVLNKFAQENMYEAAEGILFEMVQDFLSGNDGAQPRTRNFNTVLAMYSKSKRNDAAEKAEQIVSRFRELASKRLLNVYPDEYTYSLLLKTWVTSTRHDGVDRALSCLQWMREISKAGDLAATPDIVKYTTIISAYTRSGMVKQAGDLLSKMIDDFRSGNKLAKPDYKAFDIVIGACCGWNNDIPFEHCNGQLAEHFLHLMWELHQSDKLEELRPRSCIYKSIIICYKKSRDPEAAERVLYDMDCMHKTGRLDAGPSKKLFQTVVNAWHESCRLEKQSRLQKIRIEMNFRFGRTPFEQKFSFDSY